MSLNNTSQTKDPNSQFGVELSIVMPCLNEAETLSICIEKALRYLKNSNVNGEVIVADNGSSDGSQDIAKSHGVRLVNVHEKGYGAALKAGIHAAQGKYVIMGDADDSYNFLDLDLYIERLREGYELVMGNRFLGGIAPGAMPPLHKYFGNPVLTFIGKLFFKSPCNDFQCGLRGFRKESIIGLELQTPGMEFASEMVVKSSLKKLKITEVPTTLSKDGRSRPPHIRSWRDGWRNLRFMLMHSPRWLYLYPGLFLTGLGLLLTVLIVNGPVNLFGANLDLHTLVAASGMIIIGVQSLTFAWLAKQYAINNGLMLSDNSYERAQDKFSLEKAITIGIAIMFAGGTGFVITVLNWGETGFGDLDYSETMRLVVPSVTALATGFQLIMSGFMSKILNIKSS